MKDELPKSAWLVSKMGRLTAGVQYEPQRKNYTDFIPLELLYLWVFYTLELLHQYWVF